jgi:ubiquinone/menaquinone biosynthesis C-methylase UbiE
MNRSQDHHSWDSYWDRHEHSSRVLYDAIASFYRKHVIKHSLNYYVKRYYADQSILLHAGCGSGQVDVDIHHCHRIIPLDISMNALSLYAMSIPRPADRIRGDIFRLPFSDVTFDGIYNLGVMEHFSEGDIQAILGEFRRVLKKEGRLILFWPPEYGLSVVFFKALVFVFRNILFKKDAAFHPPELTRIQSRRHIHDMMDRSKFKMIQYHFGIRDLFTYAVIVAKK